MKIKKILSFEWLKSPYSITIKDPETLEEKKHFYFTPAKLIVLGFATFLLFFLFGYLILGLSSNSRKVYSSSEEEIANLYYEIDSLSNLLEANQKFNKNIRHVLGGNVKYFGDEEIKRTQVKPKITSSIDGDTSDVDYLASVDIKLRREFEKQKKNSFSSSFVASNSSSSDADIKDIFLFSPIEGIISEKYNSRKEHYGIDIVAKKDAEIKVVADGTVVFSGWTDETGHVMTVQHSNNLISVYKHCSVLLKKEGNTVKAGEIIAIIGNSGKFTTGSHLHFELWYKGSPINPEGFISF